MIFIAGGTLAFFFEFLLLAKKPKSLSDKFLAVWMLFIGLHLFLYYFNTTGIDFKYPHLLGIANPLPLIHGPLLFLYTGSLTRYFQKWKPKYLWHFLPLVIFYGYYFNFFISSGQEKIAFVKNQQVSPDIFYPILFPVILLSGFSYLLFTFLLFRKHQQNILNNLSNANEKNNLHWLRNLLIGMLAVWIIVLVDSFIIDSPLDDTLIYASLTIFIVFMGFFGLRQGNIFMNLAQEMTIEDQQRYSKSGLKAERAAEIEQLLVKLMEEEKLFLDENVSLPQLAQVLEIHPNYLSQVINERLRKNFYDFINFYRIEEFKGLVARGENKHKTLFALALDCGFNSKASFNNSFKKITGLTPSEFIKSL